MENTHTKLSLGGYFLQLQKSNILDLMLYQSTSPIRHPNCFGDLLQPFVSDFNTFRKLAPK